MVGPEAMNNPQEQATNPEAGSNLSDFEKVQENIRNLRIALSQEPNTDLQLRLDENKAWLEQGIKNANEKKYFQDVDAILDGIYNQATSSAKKPEIIMALLEYGKLDIDSPFWEDPSLGLEAQQYKGVRKYRFQLGLSRIRSSLLGQDLTDQLAETEWGKDKIGKGVGVEKRHKFIRNQNGLYELLIDPENPNDKEGILKEISLVTKDLIKFLETDVKMMDADTDKREVPTRISLINNALLDAIAHFGIDPGHSEVKKLELLISTRFLVLGANKALGEGPIAPFEAFVGPIFDPTTFRDRILGIAEDNEGLPFLASAYLEEKDGEIFRLTPDFTDPDNPPSKDPKKRDEGLRETSGERRNRIIKKMAYVKLNGGFDKDSFDGTIDPLGDMSEVELDRLLEGIEPDQAKRELVLEQARDAEDEMERLMGLFGESTRYAGPRLKQDVGDFPAGTPFEVLVKAQLRGKIMQYVPNLAQSEQLLKRILNTESAAENNILYKLRQIIDPNFKGNVSKVSALKRLEEQRRKYYDGVRDVRKNYGPYLKYGGGGLLGYKRNFYLPEYIRVNLIDEANEGPSDILAEGLTDAAELGIRDFILEEGHWTMVEFLTGLGNPPEKGGNLIGPFDLGYQVFRLGKLDKLRDAFLTEATQASLGFLQQPIKDIGAFVGEMFAADRKSGDFKENTLTYERLMGATFKSAENIMSIALRLKQAHSDRSTIVKTGDFMAGKFIEDVLNWLTTEEAKASTGFAYPEEITGEAFKKYLRELGRRLRIRSQI